MAGRTWCSWSYRLAAQCSEHDDGHPHADVVSPLGEGDEPQGSGALVLVWPGHYRRQEVWVASGANVGNWYCLGNEFGIPKVWDDPRPQLERMLDRGSGPKRPAGTVPLHPDWYDVLGRGPVHLLSHDHAAAYRAGWRNGRRRLHEEIEELAEGDSGAETGPALPRL